MAKQVRKISQLPEADPLTGDELLEIVQDGGNKRAPVSMLAGGGAVQSVQGRTGVVVITADDVGLGSVDNTSDADKPVSTAQQAALDGKVDKAAGMGLSSNDFTDPLREKLIGLEGTHWRGTFVSLAALQAGVTDPEAGDYADVDAVGADVERYIWDATDSVWVVQSGAVAPITASQVKQLYESNPDTNDFTDTEKQSVSDLKAMAFRDEAATPAALAGTGNGGMTPPLVHAAFGQYGLGAVSNIPAFDGAVTNGFWQAAEDATDFGSYPNFIVITNGDSVLQIGAGAGQANELHFRKKYGGGGAWQPVRSLYHTGNFNPDTKANAALDSYTVATAPSASARTRQSIYVSNESGGAVPAFSDGTNWLRVTDRAVIS